jgi:hypothetical protein
LFKKTVSDFLTEWRYSIGNAAGGVRMDHAWCHDVARDAAVRAAEDGRTGPLPTLEKAIASPFADAAERSVPVSETGEGQSGMRTERVTLEVTGAPGWRVHVSCIDVESVRVVEETHFDDFAQVAMERDAAIRERDAAVRKRDESLQIAQTFESLCLGWQARDKVLKARVVELEEELESVACRAATAETALEARKLTAGEELCAAHAASGVNQPETPVSSTQAASGGGDGEPVAYLIDGPFEKRAFRTRDEVYAYTRYLPEIEKQSMQLVPLYRQPPQPRGWLTTEERGAIALLSADRSQFAPQTIYELQRNAAIDVCRSFLARSSPPEVVHPECHFDQFSGCSPVHAWNICAADFRKALAAAGVAVKEVASE